jgi:Holliday junction DNA helicase RuvA
MIEHLTGTVLSRTEKSIVVDVNGVGYGIEIPETLHSHTIEIGDDIRVWIHTYVREDAIRLFGFRSFEEKQIFNLLISVSDVGPKLAMAVLSNVDIMTLVQAIDSEDVAIIEEVPGIGPRKSKKILMELKPKLERLLNSGVLKLGLLSMATADTAKFVKPGKVLGAKGPQIDRAALLDLKSALNNLGYREKEILPVVRKLEANPPSLDLGELIKAALTELSTGGRPSEAQTKDSKLQEIF